MNFTLENLNFTLEKLSFTLENLNFTCENVNFTLEKLNIQLLEMNFTLLNMNFTLVNKKNIVLVQDASSCSTLSERNVGRLSGNLVNLEMSNPKTPKDWEKLDEALG